MRKRCENGHENDAITCHLVISCYPVVISLLARCSLLGYLVVSLLLPRCYPVFSLLSRVMRCSRFVIWCHLVTSWRVISLSFFALISYALGFACAEALAAAT